MKNINLYLFFCFTIVMMSFFDGCSTPPTPPSSTPPVSVAPAQTKSSGVYIHPLSVTPIPAKVKQYDVSRKWRYIVIHHSASVTGNAARFDKIHREQNGWSRGLGYDFVIGNGNGSNNGKIEVGPRWIKQIDGAHAGVKEYNRYGIGICLVGNFEKTQPTQKQISSLISLIRYLQKRYNIPAENVILHKHVKTTACPGTKFPYYAILSNIHA